MASDLAKDHSALFVNPPHFGMFGLLGTNRAFKEPCGPFIEP